VFYISLFTMCRPNHTLVLIGVRRQLEHTHPPFWNAPRSVVRFPSSHSVRERNQFD